MTSTQPVNTNYPLDYALVVSRPFTPHRGVSLTGLLSPFLISFDPRFKPQQVVLIFDQDDVHYGHAFEMILSSLGIHVVRWEISSQRVEISAHQIARYLDEWKQPLPLCIGGEKASLFTLVASVFAERGCPLIQVKDSVLYRLGARSVKTRLEPKIDLRLILSHLGARLSAGWEGVWFEHHLQELSHFFISSAQGCVAPLEVIQRLARDTDSERLLSPIVKGVEVAIPLFQEVLDRFERAGCVELSQGRLRFSSELHRAYCAGGWLSLYLEATLNDLKHELKFHCALQDLKLELAYPNPLEVSVPLTAAIGDHLCLFFCVSSGSEILDGLLKTAEQLIDILGVSVFMLSIDPLSQFDQERARLLGISTCVAEDLKRLPAWLIEVFKG